MQFGLLGARETHAITEAVARHAPSGTRERAAAQGEIEIEIEIEVDEGELAG
ncbi:MAG TPA: hypothetical protein VH054_29840 [Polyangiaceae bacterium]|nr:hypothetical protein [Polyangiaceae bacterium]